MMLRDHDEMLLRLPGTVEEREWLEAHRPHRGYGP